MENIFLYTYTGDSKVINKTLNDGLMVEGLFYKNSSLNLLSPYIQFDSTLSLSNFLSYNYCFIPSVNRYYFITNISVNNSNSYVCSLNEDVLKSFETEIAEIYGTVTSAENADKYSSNYNTLHNVKPTTTKYNFDNNFNEDGSIIMVALRGI